MGWDLAGALASKNPTHLNRKSANTVDCGKIVIKITGNDLTRLID